MCSQQTRTWGWRAWRGPGPPRRRRRVHRARRCAGPRSAARPLVAAGAGSGRSAGRQGRARGGTASSRRRAGSPYSSSARRRSRPASFGPGSTPSAEAAVGPSAEQPTIASGASAAADRRVRQRDPDPAKASGMEPTVSHVPYTGGAPRSGAQPRAPGRPISRGVSRAYVSRGYRRAHERTQSGTDERGLSQPV